MCAILTLASRFAPPGRRAQSRSVTELRVQLLLTHPKAFFQPACSIEGEYVPVEGDELSYKVCSIPPKYEKVQAVEVNITHLKPGTKHETWSGHVITS